MTIFRITINNACVGGACDSCSPRVRGENVPVLYKSTTLLTISSNLVTILLPYIEYPSIVRAVWCNYASAGNVKREGSQRANGSLKYYFDRKSRHFIQLWERLALSRAYVARVRTFRKLRAISLLSKRDIDKNRKAEKNRQKFALNREKFQIIACISSKTNMIFCALEHPIIFFGQKRKLFAQIIKGI